MKKLAALSLILGLCCLLGPAKTSSASSCTTICNAEHSDCLSDCRFFPYTGCANDCWQEWQICLAGC